MKGKLVFPNNEMYYKMTDIRSMALTLVYRKRSMKHNPETKHFI